MPGQRRPGPKASLPQDGWLRAPRRRQPPHRRTGRARPGPGRSRVSEPAGKGVKRKSALRIGSPQGAAMLQVRARTGSSLPAGNPLDLSAQPPPSASGHSVTPVSPGWGRRTPNGSTCDFDPVTTSYQKPQPPPDLTPFIPTLWFWIQMKGAEQGTGTLNYEVEDLSHNSDSSNLLLIY